MLISIPSLSAFINLFSRDNGVKMNPKRRALNLSVICVWDLSRKNRGDGLISKGKAARVAHFMI